MFESPPALSYSEIFDQRGAQYHEAMLAQPRARAAEFAHLARLAECAPGHAVADLPAGGGYLRPWLPAGLRLFSVETSRGFLRQRSAGEKPPLLCASLAKVPLPSASLDRVLSLAGVHHLEDQPAFYREAWRLLKPGGRFVMADVRAGSTVARFLNEWVHAHNSQGHRGRFLTAETPAQLSACGFEVLSAEPVSYRWNFTSQPAALAYGRGLFGLDLATDEQILDAFEKLLDFRPEEARCTLAWELFFLTARK